MKILTLQDVQTIFDEHFKPNTVASFDEHGNLELHCVPLKPPGRGTRPSKSKEQER